MKIVAISDLHNHYNQITLPEGDLLIIAGDFSNLGTFKEIILFNNWLFKMKFLYKKIIVIAGNHDIGLEQEKNNIYNIYQLTNCIYLENNLYDFEYEEDNRKKSVRIWGSPQSARFGYGWAFQLDRGEAAQKHWQAIPWDTEILIVHGPPFGILDLNREQEHVGCMELRWRIEQLPKLKLVITGHIHESQGMYEKDGITYLNVAMCSTHNKLINRPTIFEFIK